MKEPLIIAWKIMLHYPKKIDIILIEYHNTIKNLSTRDGLRHNKIIHSPFFSEIEY